MTEMVRIPAGSFVMGSTEFYPEEGPVHERTVETFDLDQHPVTNEEFAEFVAATGYVTVAERPLDPELFPELPEHELSPGALLFTPTSGPVRLDDWRQWWRWVPGANWKQPAGPRSHVRDRPTHPVIHVSYEDANAYAAWAGKRLPTEVEWEFAATHPDGPATYAWGNELHPNGELMANNWQGRFPYLNTGAKGWAGTSPVGSFPANHHGLVDMIGNVWEWTSTEFAERHATPSSCQCGPSPSASADGQLRRALKGGSHLCAPEYCLRYRPAARSPQSEDTATSHIGFRCARDV
ncbi:formylglycine-generating enzyme family protein [Leucobacter viscericola]|uniref:Formylglycine-generating enzyme family protein n=1 Tax=Leucobacter viscericola TaxID=2714935 RepID=A0A6G7XBV9_9MICO|nr:formylglycine-generating enzyme family protein [Leucobacter viscericola]QIK62045.1 formylglycine-generating enzyme family protein [Leucobacter viscericola]